jgi:hypothetical protein
MTTTELIENIVQWVVGVIPEIKDAYDHATDQRDSLPDVAVEVNEWRVTEGRQDARLAKLNIEQIRVRVYELEIILVVTPDPPGEAEGFLKDFTDRLVDDLLVDPTLSGRVAWVNTNPRVSFRPPFVEFDDGTRGRIASLFIQVGQTLEV